MAKEMKEGRGRGLLSRRGFLKMTGCAGGAAILGSWGTGVERAFGLEPFPGRKTTWIVGVAAGGSKDLRVRGLAPYVQKYLKAVSRTPDNVGVVVKNMPGANGMRSMSYIRNSAKPDGYELLLGSETLHVRSVLGTLGFNPLELTYISRISSGKKILVTNNKSNINSWDDLVKASKKGPLRIGVSGFGGSNHIAAMFFIDTTKLNAKPVLFDGEAGLSAALLRQDVPAGMYSEDGIKHLVDAQELRPLLTFSKESLYPIAQNIKDAGFPQLNDVLDGQNYIVAPPKMPAHIKKILAEAFQKALADKEFLAWCGKLGIGVDPVFGADLDTMINTNQKFFMSKEQLLKKFLSDTA